MNNDIIEVKYKYEDIACSMDLVCELTEFMDQYLLSNKKSKYACTYLYNDLCEHSTPNLLRIAFRYPGATMGSILLKRLDSRKFKIVGFHFNTDVCFDEFATYDKKLADDIDIYIGRVLSFANVRLINNGVEYTYLI